MNNSQLPVDVQAQIEQQARDYAQTKCDDLADKKGLHRKTLLTYAHMAGATEWVTKLQETEQEKEQLRRWKMEAAELLTKINSYAHKHLEIKLGQCAVDFVIARAKERDELKARCEKMEAALENIAIQKTCEETENDPDGIVGSDGTKLGDIEMGYDCCIGEARKALGWEGESNTPAPGEGKEVGDEKAKK